MDEHYIALIGESVAIPKFPESTLFQLCDFAEAIYHQGTNVVDIKAPIIVVGDIHGNLHDLIRVFRTLGRPPSRRYLFLGDYVDRGDFSTEVMTLLLALHCHYPNDVILLRGNHEFSAVNSEYGFRDEIMKEYGTERLWRRFNEVFNYMPLAAIIDGEVLCVHGGLGPKLTSISQIVHAPRPLTKENTAPSIRQLLWDDPSDEIYLYQESSTRGATLWGFGATEYFFEENRLTKLIRGHECVREGIMSSHNGKVITVFTSSNYDHVLANDAAVLIVESPENMTIHSWSPVKVKSREASMFYSVAENHAKREARGRFPGASHKLAGQRLFNLSRAGQLMRGSSLVGTTPYKKKWVTMSHSFLQL